MSQNLARRRLDAEEKLDRGSCESPRIQGRARQALQNRSIRHLVPLPSYFVLQKNPHSYNLPRLSLCLIKSHQIQSSGTSGKR